MGHSRETHPETSLGEPRQTALSTRSLRPPPSNKRNIFLPELYIYLLSFCFFLRFGIGVDMYMERPCQAGSPRCGPGAGPCFVPR